MWNNSLQLFRSWELKKWCYACRLGGQLKWHETVGCWGLQSTRAPPSYNLALEASFCNTCWTVERADSGFGERKTRKVKRTFLKVIHPVAVCLLWGEAFWLLRISERKSCQQQWFPPLDIKRSEWGGSGEWYSAYNTLPFYFCYWKQLLLRFNCPLIHHPPPPPHHPRRGGRDSRYAARHGLFRHKLLNRPRLHFFTSHITHITK